MLSFAVGDGSGASARTPGWLANACTNGAGEPAGAGVGDATRVDADARDGGEHAGRNQDEWLPHPT